jgi:prolyl 4-hydroxylase
MISLDDAGGLALKNFIWENVQPIIEEWVGYKVKPTSLYGIRVYSDGAVLGTHVDRLPLVSSCIIQVSQDLDEPWPVEVISHAGKAYNVTMSPGDMVLYESHTVLHGRPYRMRGRHYANVFVHYEPIEHAKLNKDDREPGKHLDRAGLEALHRLHGDSAGGHEAFNHDAEDLARLGETEEGEEEEEEEDERQTGAHMAARDGDMDVLVALLRRDVTLLNQPDKNGWMPLHEAARGGHLACLQYLIQMGADVGSLTKYGGTALWWARRSLPAGHGVIAFLEEIGALDVADKGGVESAF